MNGGQQEVILITMRPFIGFDMIILKIMQKPIRN